MLKTPTKRLPDASKARPVGPCGIVGERGLSSIRRDLENGAGTCGAEEEVALAVESNANRGCKAGSKDGFGSIGREPEDGSTAKIRFVEIAGSGMRIDREECCSQCKRDEGETGGNIFSRLSGSLG